MCFTECTYRDAPDLRIVSPKPEQVLAGLAPIVVTFVKPWGYQDWSLAFDAETLGNTKEKRAPGTTGLSFDTRNLSNGAHSLHAGMYALGFRSWETSVEFKVDNPTQRLLHTEVSRSSSEGTVHWSVELRFNRSDLDLRVVAVNLENTPPSQVLVQKLDNVRFRLSLQAPASALNKRTFTLELAVSDAEREATEFLELEAP